MNIDAAALYIFESKNTKVFNNIFKYNSAKNVGGGCVVQKYDAVLANNIFYRNEATYGAAVAAADNAKVHLVNNTLYENKAPNNGGSGVFVANAAVKVLNTICWDDPSAGVEFKIYGEGSVAAAYSDVRGGFEGEGILDENPVFIDSLLTLSNSSPCLGSGVKEYDFDGVVVSCPDFDCNNGRRPIPAGSNPDLGAIESPVASFVENVQNNLPSEFTLNQNYPNPFNPETTISYSLPGSSQVRLVLYNLLGHHVRTLIDEQQLPGSYVRVWDGRNDAGMSMASGVYLCRLTAGTFDKAIKLTLSK